MMTKTTLVKVLVALIAALYLGGCGCSVEDNDTYASASPTEQSASANALSVELATFDYAPATNKASTRVRLTDESLLSVRLTLSLTRADGTPIGAPLSWTGTPEEAAAGVEIPLASRIRDGESITVRAAATAPDGRFGSVVRTVAVH